MDDKVADKLRAAGIFDLLAKASNQNREDSLPIGKNRQSRKNNDNCIKEDCPELVDDENDDENLPV